METMTLCGWSAFRMHRVPPVALWLALLADADHLRRPSARGYRKAAHLLARLGFDAPADICAPTDRLRPTTAHLNARVRKLSTTTIKPVSQPVPIPLDVLEHLGLASPPFDLRALSPEASLLSLAPRLGPERLALAASELMGSFGIFRPTPDLQSRLSMAARKGATSPSTVDEAGTLPRSIRREARYGRWQQLTEPDKAPSNLWQRDPLLTHARLAAFVQDAEGLHGCDILRGACRMAVPGTASPFEAQAAILLGQPRRRGGEGLGTPVCNKKVVLDPGAKALAHQAVCYCDLYFEGPRSGRRLAIECHSRTWHARGDEKRVADANRQAALERMGIDVMLLTHEMLRDAKALSHFVELARAKLGLRQPRDSKDLRERRERLRSAVLGVRDWEGFGL